MNLHINNLFNQYCYKNKNLISHDLLSNQFPYYSISDTENSDLQYRKEYVDLCTKKAISIWNKYKFSNELIVLYEDKYSCHNKNEKEFVESTLMPLNYTEYKFKWNDDEELYEGTRYIWKTDKINIEDLFRKIILSDLGEDTELDCAVYIIDNKNENVFFLYDDRGIDIYLNDKDFVSQ